MGKASGRPKTASDQLLATAPDLDGDAHMWPPWNIQNSLTIQDVRRHGLRHDRIINERALGAHVAGGGDWGRHDLPIHTHEKARLVELGRVEVPVSEYHPW
eukprot:7731896-Pyramimonas_sp.AAC.1